MMRWATYLLTLLSALLCAAAVAVWVRVRFVGDM